MGEKQDALREKILDCARAIALSEGIEQISIRRIAGQAGVSVGTVYNYFTDKEELLLLLTEEYWQDVLQEMDSKIAEGDFCSQLSEIYTFLQEQVDGPGGSYMNSLIARRNDGQDRMRSMEQTLSSILSRRMEQSPTVRKSVWDDAFTREQYSRFLVVNLMALLRDQEDLSFFLKIVKKTICKKRKG
ncbi:MAG: TetR/AcrR family transcriptional regulator [Oscillospiraceae bacterium]|nr:TetR/AcrR family transcriptional regulator [Oscillospiraceae bacterium]